MGAINLGELVVLFLLQGYYWGSLTYNWGPLMFVLMFLLLCRDMSKTFLAKFNCSGEGFNSLLDECTSFADLCATIRKRYKLPLTEVFRLQYASPSCPVIY